jgi:hypothetical protein
MALLYISEYTSLRIEDTGNPAPVAWEGDGTIDQTPVVIGATSAQSLPFAKGTRFVRLHTDVICHIKFGSNPTATAVKRMAAGQTEIFGVNPGDKVAVIQGT